MQETHGFGPIELALLYRVARFLLHEREYGELLAGLLDVTIETLGADRGFVLLHEAGRFRATASRNFRSEALARTEEEVSSSIATAALEQGRALLIGDALGAEQFRDNPSVRRLALRSVLCAPLIANDEAFALIYLENRDVVNLFKEDHRRLLDEICALAAPRLRTAVVVEEARKRAQQLELTLGASDGILTADAAMVSMLQTVHQIATTDLPVLVQGETGTGKELVARALYHHSGRSRGPFVVVNCAAIPANLVESELFGHVRGAFTGAERDRDGLIGTAHRGTLFLDEVGELPAELQPRLLRVLQSGEFTRVGSTRVEVVDVRCVAATNRDLDREVEAGKFRSDLYFRLAAVTVKVPPLRERPHDIRLLSDHYIQSYAARYGRERIRLSPECLEALTTYSLPGNVRELQSEIARLVAVSPPGAIVGTGALNERIRRSLGQSEAGQPAETVAPMSLAEMEKRLILSVLQNTEGNRTRAAEILGISREGLRTKMQRLGLTDSG